MSYNIGITAMPTYRKFELKAYDLRVSVQPTGIRRIFRCMPYLTGQNAKFIITLETSSGKPKEFSHISKCYFISADRNVIQVSHDEILITPISQIEHKFKTELSIPFISLAGHYSAEFTFNYQNRTRTEPVIELYALSKDLLITNLFITSITLIIGGIIGWFLGQI